MRLLAALGLCCVLLLGGARGQTVTAVTPPLIYPLGQSNIPFVLAPTGTMGNNGALNLGANVAPSAYPNAYIYLPASAIFSGSAVGWYFVQFSTTAAGTVFNNTYAGTGTPSIPTSPTPFVTTGPGAYTGVTTAIPAYEFVILANTIGPNDRLEFTGTIANNSSGTTKTFQFRAGTAGASGNLLSAFGNTTNIGGSVRGGFVANGVTSTQSATEDNFSNGYGLAGGGIVQMNMDMTQNQTLTFLMTHATATDVAVLNNVSVQKIVGVP